MSMVCEHTQTHIHSLQLCSRNSPRIWSIHTELTGRPCYTHATRSKRKQETVRHRRWYMSMEDSFFPPFLRIHTHARTYTHTHTQICAPSQHHDPVDPEACNIPFTLKLNGKLEFHLLANMCTCIHTRPLIANTLQRLDQSTVSWMWNRFACDIAGLKFGIKTKKNKTKQKKSNPSILPPWWKSSPHPPKKHNTINKTVMTTFMGEKGKSWREKWRERE